MGQRRAGLFDGSGGRFGGNTRSDVGSSSASWPLHKLIYSIPLDGGEGGARSKDAAKKRRQVPCLSRCGSHCSMSSASPSAFFRSFFRDEGDRIAPRGNEVSPRTPLRQEAVRRATLFLVDGLFLLHSFLSVSTLSGAIFVAQFWSAQCRTKVHS